MTRNMKASCDQLMQIENGIITDKEMKNRRDTSELEKQFYSSSDYPSHKPPLMQIGNDGSKFKTTNSYDSLLASEEIEMPRKSENGTNNATKYADAKLNEDKVITKEYLPVWNNTTSYMPQLSKSKFSTPEFSEPRFSSSPIADQSLKPPFNVIENPEMLTTKNEDNRLHTNDYKENRLHTNTKMPFYEKCLREIEDPALLAFLRKHNMFGHSSTDSSSHSDYESANSSTKFYQDANSTNDSYHLITHLKPRFIV